MFKGLFDMDNSFWQWVGRIPDMVVLSLCWYICCIPIVTIIPASCALYDCISRNLMMDEKGYYARFFRTFWRELKHGIPLTLLWLFSILILLFGFYMFSAANQGSSPITILSVMYLIFTVMVLGYLGWLIPLQSRYNQSFLQLHINAAKFTIARLPGTALMLLVTFGVVAVSLLHHFTLPLLLVAPALITIIHTFPVEKAFRIAFPNDYVGASLVANEEERKTAETIRDAKRKERSES